MRTIWSVARLPELGGLSPRGRRALLKGTRGGGQVQIMLAALLCVALLGPVFAAICFFPWARGLWPRWLSALVAALVLAILGGLIYQALLAGLRRELRIRLRQSAPEGRLLKCLDCGYDLRGSRGCQCPECGASVLVGQTEPPRG